MTRPLSSQEKAQKNQQAWFAAEEKKARDTRGERGQMEFWLRVTRARIAKESKAGRTDVFAGFVLVCRLFTLAMEKRASGDRRLWENLLQYAQQVLEHDAARN